MAIGLAHLGRLLIVDFPDKVHKARYPFLNPAERCHVSELTLLSDESRDEGEG
jgi:hypothetical protein